jgi:hypothetical protein
VPDAGANMGRDNGRSYTLLWVLVTFAAAVVLWLFLELLGRV